MGQKRRSQHVRNESAYPPIAAGEQTSRLVGSVPISEAASVTLFERVARIFYFVFLMDTEPHVAERIRIGGVGA
jgi:hypothetical protein